MTILQRKAETAARLPLTMLASGELGCAAALAACYLWIELASGRPQTIVINHCQLARDLGSSETSARRWLDTLRQKGYLEVRDADPRAGTTTAYIFNPDDVIGRRGVAAGDPQGLLFSEQALPSPPSSRDGSGDTTVAVLRPEPAYAHARSVLRESKQILTRSPSVTFTGPAQREQGVDGSGVTSVAAVLAVAGRRLPTPEERAASVEDLVAWQLRRVACPNLRQAPCLKVAWRVVEGEIPQREVDAILTALDAARSSEAGLPRDPSGQPMPASQFYVGRVKNLFRRRGVDWNAAAHPPGA